MAGGVGGAKLLVGLERALGDGELTAVVNTGDDATIYGVHICPDVDIVTYWLAGIADFERGWGLAGDSFDVVDSLGKLGAESWFRLGDRDFATCLFRTERLRAGATLTAITDEIRRALGVPTTVLPMSDDEVRTIVHTSEGRELDFQTYFVKERTLPEVRRVDFEGATSAKAAPGVLDAIADAEVVVVCPSNPILSIAPILALPGVRDALVDHPRVIAMSPLVGGRALKGPADRIMKSLGIGATNEGIASLYRDFCDLLVIDVRETVRAIEGIDVKALDTVMSDHEASERLARELLGP